MAMASTDLDSSIDPFPDHFEENQHPHLLNVVTGALEMLAELSFRQRFRSISCISVSIRSSEADGCKRGGKHESGRRMGERHGEPGSSCMLPCSATGKRGWAHERGDGAGECRQCEQVWCTAGQRR